MPYTASLLLTSYNNFVVTILLYHVSWCETSFRNKYRLDQFISPLIEDGRIFGWFMLNCTDIMHDWHENGKHMFMFELEGELKSLKLIEERIGGTIG